MESSKRLKSINTGRNTNTVVNTKMEEEEPLTLTARLLHAPQLNYFVIAVMGCKTMINVNVIKEGLKQTLVKHPRFSSNLTINDVVLGITQAGISYYLNRKYGEIKGEEKAKFDNLPKHIRFRSSVIVNLRPASTIENLAENMEASTKGKWKWGNAIAYVHLPFHIAIRNDPLDYIRNAKVTMDRKKHSLGALCTSKITRIVLKTLGFRATAALVYRVISHPSLVFSNVVGPKEEISFFGHPVAFIAPSACGLPQALIVHFQSYMDKMTLVLAIDQDVIPDPQRLCDDIEESLRLAYKAIIEQNLSVAEPGF